LHSHRLRAVSLLAALAALFAMLAAAASAQAAPVRQIQLNVGTPKLALEAQFDQSVKLVPSNSSQARQRWVEVDHGTTVSFRNQGTLQCLREVSPQSPTQLDLLKVGSCTDLNTGLPRWQFRTGSIANSGVQIQNAATGRVIMSLFDTPVLVPKFTGDQSPNFSEWRLPKVGETL
jgi:hypothetical protein